MGFCLKCRQAHGFSRGSLTDKGEWRRIYPVPWEAFWKEQATRFKKKQWIEYELESEKPSDYRPERRKVKWETIRVLGEAPYAQINGLLGNRVTTIEELESNGPKIKSLGAVKPMQVVDFLPMDNQQYEKQVYKQAQQTLNGKSAVKLEIPAYKYQYVFKDDVSGREHRMLCEDWEVGELYRHCEDYHKKGKYANEAEVQAKVREKMMGLLAGKPDCYFIVGSHSVFPTYMIVGVVYPKKSDIGAK